METSTSVWACVDVVTKGVNSVMISTQLSSSSPLSCWSRSKPPICVRKYSTFGARTLAATSFPFSESLEDCLTCYMLAYEPEAPNLHLGLQESAMHF